jgi:myo-inositol-1-phosphate synthase
MTVRTRVFDVLEQRGQKQRWLLAEMERRGYRVSEGYLSQIKAGTKQPGRQFIDAACEILGMPERELFYQDDGGEHDMAARDGKRVAKAPASAAKPGRAGRRGDGKINVAIIGVGNCASSLVQGRYFYQDARQGDLIPGLMHVDLGGYHIRDINFVAAIDIDENKVGKDLSEAVFAAPNNTYKFSDVPHQGVRVARGMTHDGLGKYLSQVITKAKGPTDDIVRLLKETETDVVVSYLPVGSEEATKWYVEQVLAAGCGFINCIPVFIARDFYGYWPKRFEEAGLPIIGDDIKSQVGATIVHRMLTRLFRERGVRLDRTYQLNFGGNTDFLNMLERERLESKKISKTNAVTSQLDYELPADDVHVGPSDHVPWLLDRKWCYIRMEGTTFGNVPLNAELKLEVWDSPNSAGVVIDAIRCCKIALDRGLAGPLTGPSAYFMKSPPQQFPDDVAHDMVEEFIAG